MVRAKREHKFEKSARRYVDTLGFIPSDVICLPDGTPVGSFMRVDRR